MEILLALTAAVLVGSGDFLGGFASRREGAGQVVTLVHLIGIPVALVVAPLLGGSATAADLLWGAGSGASGGLGLWLLYRGFQGSRVAVVSPLAAVLAASIPVLIGLAAGERPGSAGASGLALGVVAVVLVSRPGRDGGSGSTRLGVLHGLGAGIGFAGLFVMLSLAGDDSAMWPIVTSRIAGFAVLLAVLRRPPTVRRPTLRFVAAGGTFSVLGTGAFLLATHEGPLSVVTVITSLYPAVTVLWARIWFGERLTSVQGVGLVLALAAIGLLSV